MRTMQFRVSWVAMGTAVAFLGIVGGTARPAAAQCCSGHDHGSSHQAEHAGSHESDGGHDHAGHHAAGPQTGPEQPSLKQRPPHGGQVTAAQSIYFFEVVYQAREIRVYLYGPSQEPLSPKGVRGQVVLRLNGQKRDYEFPLKYAAPPAKSNEPGYLAAAVDVSRVRDGDMTATFLLDNLPHRQHAKASFAQTFALSRQKPKVAVATLNEGDQERISQQRACPVSGQKLGAHGTPVKLVVGEEVLFLCCKGCLGKVEGNPDLYVARAAQESGGR